MRPDTEVRAFRDLLVDVVNCPCHCSKNGHDAECAAARDFANGHRLLLDWVLDEDSDGLVQKLFQDARAQLASYRRHF